MSHADPVAREGFWGRTRRWLTDTYDEPVDELNPEPAELPTPDLADDLRSVMAALLQNPATYNLAGPQSAIVNAVIHHLSDLATWINTHPDATAEERAATAQRAVFNAVQGGIDVVKPAAALTARRAALEEAAAYVAAQRSVTEAAEGLRRHLDDPALPVRVERYPHAELLARTTGPLPVVAAAEAVEVIDIN